MPEAIDAFFTSIRAHWPSLGPGEQQVALRVLEHPIETVDSSTAQLATAAQVSGATVVRACQALGFRGFQHLRLELARALPGSDEDASPQPRTAATALTGTTPSGSPATPDPSNPAADLFARAARSLHRAAQLVDGGGIADAACAVATARRVLIVASGFSAPAAQDCALRLVTLGIAAQAPGDVLAQQFIADTLDERDACIAVSYSGANTHTVAAVRRARDRGARVIAVTSFERSPLTRLAGTVLVSGGETVPHGVDPFVNRLHHQVTLAALAEAVEAEDASRGRTGERLEARDIVAAALADDERVDSLDNLHRDVMEM